MAITMKAEMAGVIGELMVPAGAPLFAIAS